MSLDMYLSTNSKKVCKAALEAIGGEMWRLPYGDAIYWRKANAIHGWFVDNLMGGNDNCSTCDVSVPDLIKLRDTCKEVIAGSKLVDGDVLEFQRVNPGTGRLETVKERVMVIEDPSTAERLLPTRSGFFFGSTGYDDYYFDQLVITVKGIDAILDNVEQYTQHSVGDLTWSSWREKGEVDEWNVTFHYHASW